MEFLREVDVPVIQMEWVHISRQIQEAKDMVSSLTSLGYVARPVADSVFTAAEDAQLLNQRPIDVFWVKRQYL